jgi:hypothetical protein
MSEGPHLCMACAWVVFARLTLQVGAAPVLNLMSLSKNSCTLFGKPPWPLIPGCAKFVCVCSNSFPLLNDLVRPP